jgi:hypothetical protein
MAVVIYLGIVQRRLSVKEEKVQTNGAMNGTDILSRQYSLPLESYLLGWGVIIPLAVAFPYPMLRFLQIHNKVIKMSLATTTFIVAFRCIEAMYHTSPAVVETNLMTYVVYYSSILHFEWDPVACLRRPVMAMELLRNFLYLGATMGLLSLVLSWEMHYQFRPFASPSPVQLHEYHLNYDLWQPAHLGNMYGLAVLTYLTLSFGFDLTAIGEQFKGYYTAPLFDLPLWTSRGPTEFWTLKWNRMIHIVLKYGAFYPARQFCSPRLAVLLTFIVSGLVHDFVWSLIFYRHDPQDDLQFAPVVFKLTAFFLWNGVVMVLERPVGRLIQPVSSQLPTIVVSTLVVLTALPVAHWYVGDWVEGGYFRDLSIGLWTIRKL